MLGSIRAGDWTDSKCPPACTPDAGSALVWLVQAALLAAGPAQHAECAATVRAGSERCASLPEHLRGPEATPTALPRSRRHVRTLVLDLDDTLVHSDWTRGRGWRTFKRPGAEDFIRQLAQYYELVVFTSQLPTCAGLRRMRPAFNPDFQPDCCAASHSCRNAPCMPTSMPTAPWYRRHAQARRRPPSLGPERARTAAAQQGCG
jgi:hypothetical protein